MATKKYCLQKDDENAVRLGFTGANGKFYKELKLIVKNPAEANAAASNPSVLFAFR